MDQFAVSLAPTESASLRNIERDPEEASRWSLSALTTTPGYVAALAVEGHNWRPTFWQFSESTSEASNFFQSLRHRSGTFLRIFSQWFEIFHIVLEKRQFKACFYG
jgi:hypothetical protein